MIYPEHIRPAEVVTSLALDAAVPLYARLGVPPGKGSQRMHGFLKEAVEYAQFARANPAFWGQIESYGQNTLPPQEQEMLLGWLRAAFTGYHPANPDLSGWLIAIDYFNAAPANWKGVEMTGPEVLEAQEFISAYFKELDEPKFLEEVEACRGRGLSSWDKRLHTAYGFVYHDREAGADPFLILRFVHQGEALRRTIANFGFVDRPDFPHTPFRDAAQQLIDKRHIWMPEGTPLSALADVT